MIDDTLEYLFIVTIFLCILYIFVCQKQNSEIEIIKKTQNYSVYDHCRCIDKKYYCYNNVEERK